MLQNKKYFYLFPSIIVLLVFLTSYSLIYKKIEGSIYNVVLGLKKEIKEHESILLVDFGDEAIEMAETYPVSRDIYGDGLFLLKEFNSLYTVFDIEFVDPSPRGVNNNILEEDIPLLLDNEFAKITTNTTNLFNALANGDISLTDGKDFVSDLNSISDGVKTEIGKQIRDIAKDSDIYLGKSANIFGHSFFTININEADYIDDEETFNYFKENLAYDINFNNSSFRPEFPGVIPTILDISQYAKGVGFTNVIVDEDGVRRKVDLLRTVEDKTFLQLAFSPLIDWYGNPDLSIDKNILLLKNINFPLEPDLKELKIPLNSDGTLNINWLPYTYVDSFKHLPYEMLMAHDQLYDKLINNLRVRIDWGYLNFYTGDTPLMTVIDYLEAERKALYNAENPNITSFRDTRNFLLDELQSFVTTETADNFIEVLNTLYAAGNIDEFSYNSIKEDIPVWFNGTGIIIEELLAIRKKLANIVPDSFAIIGNTATGTTDIGVNPFQEEYMNVGTHASVINTILNREFITLAPQWVYISIALISSLLLSFLIMKESPRRSLFIGTISIITLVVVLILYFRFTLNYVDLLFPVLSQITSFILVTAYNLINTENEKRFINTAFSHYLSVDVINEIINDPSKLKLGGEKKYMTTMFTDVKGFSSFAEKLPPEDLVRLLNRYLTEMSDTVMHEKGTIDKYEGDAIVCFFGAPIHFEDHAYRCCKSAVVMKRLEKELNEEFIRDKWTDENIYTRIGINTGDMIVGNMGTQKKMDYTVMGNAVNLAARLEGVNKIYGTWILVSEETRKHCPDKLLFRKLDRVRVVGIKKPVRIYELVEERNHLTVEEITAYRLFEEAIDIFENQAWEEAITTLEKVKEILPDDKVTDLYIDRCKGFIQNPPHKEWDGVFKLNAK